MNLSFIAIILGLLALILGWTILFRSGIIFGINAWIRENVFSDKWILYSRRRLALLFLGLGIIALFSGMDAIVQEKNLSPEAAKQLIVQAEGDFQKSRYKNVVSKCLEVLKSQPKNVRAWELLGGAWWALGDEKSALSAVSTIKGIDPEFPIHQSPILNAIEKTSLKKSAKKPK